MSPAILNLRQNMRSDPNIFQKEFGMIYNVVGFFFFFLMFSGGDEMDHIRGAFLSPSGVKTLFPPVAFTIK